MSNLTIMKINKSQIITLAKNLRSLLDERGVSESDIAHSINIPVMTVRRIVSGETSDPRISTLKLLADYFDVSIDCLVGENDSNPIIQMTKNMPKFVPVLDWNTATNIKSIKELDLKSWNEWYPITLGDQYILSDNAFALESRPSMQPRFPLGTLFIIEPNENPTDGDMVLIRMNKDSNLSLRELIIDPPKWQLQPVVIGSETLFYQEKEHIIVGIVILTLLYTRRASK